MSGRTALPELLEAAVLQLLEAAAGCAVLAELREAAEEKKLRSEVAGSSALLHVLFVVDGSLNRPRQQSVLLCGLNGQSLGCSDLFIEELVEC